VKFNTGVIFMRVVWCNCRHCLMLNVEFFPFFLCYFFARLVFCMPLSSGHAFRQEVGTCALGRRIGGILHVSESSKNAIGKTEKKLMLVLPAGREKRRGSAQSMAVARFSETYVRRRERCYPTIVECYSEMVLRRMALIRQIKSVFRRRACLTFCLSGFHLPLTNEVDIMWKSPALYAHWVYVEWGY